MDGDFLRHASFARGDHVFEYPTRSSFPRKRESGTWKTVSAWMTRKTRLRTILSVPSKGNYVQEYPNGQRPG